MEEIIKGLKDSFQNYQEQVIKLFQDVTAPWDKLFETYENPDICRGLFYIIQNFLEGDKTQLFIQLPTDELGKDNEIQKKNLSEIQEAITDFMLLATKNSWERKLCCPKIEEMNVGEYYYFPDYTWKGHDDYIWETVEDEGGLRLKCIDPRGKHKPRKSDAKQVFEKHRGNGIKLTKDSETSGNLHKIANKFAFYKELPAPTSMFEADSCILIGSKSANPLLSRDSINSPVTHATNYANLVDEPCDVLVILWDRKYRNFEIEINNLIASGDVRKVILLGTETFEGFKDNSENMCFPFTYREIFSYYYNPQRDYKNRFPNIVFKKIDFPYLQDEILRLNSYIPDSFLRKDRQRILGLALRPFIFRKYGEPNIDRLREILYNDYPAMSNADIEEILNWVDAFPHTGITPKEESNPTTAWDQTFDIDPTSSYKRDLSKHLSGNSEDRTQKKHPATNNNNQYYIIDAPLNVYKVVDCVKALLSRGAMGTYLIMSYFELPKLKDFFESEIKVYRSKDRFELLKIRFEFETKKQNAVSNNLLDYYNDDFTDEILFAGTAQRQIVQNQKFECDFDGITDTVTLENGPVIYFSNTIKVEDLHKYKSDYLPCKITYYQKPQNFQQLMSIYYNFPRNESVESFAKFWKERLREMLRERYDSDLELMQKDFRFLSQAELKRITRNSYQSMFPHKIDSIANVMAKLKFITAEESKYIKAAHDIVGEYSINGQNLKASLIEYKLTGKIDEFLKTIIDNASDKGLNITADNILAQCMFTETLIDINKKK